ncbi:MAG: hypothetical protein HZB39_10575 [Planctomycetes bacterium]|nr:hypothetical protein [Planctomycetota bacterium]
MSAWSKERREVLAELAAANGGRRIVVIGAVAVAHHLGAGFRTTLDFDLCVASAREDTRVPAGWTAHPSIVHRWSAAGGLTIDLVCIGDDDLARGFVAWPDGTRLDLGGVDLALRDAEPIGCGLPAMVCVASLRALFVCKVFAWNDRRWDRRKDLGDLARILDRYVELDDERCFVDPALPLELDLTERPAFLLGRDLAAVGSEPQRTAIERFALEMADEATQPHAAMASHWPRDPTALGRRRR